MDHLEIINRAAAGEELSAEERAELKNFRPDGALRQELETLQRRNRELTVQLEELSNSALSPDERAARRQENEWNELRESARVASEERDRARQELQELRFRQQIGEAAGQYHFTDPEYLGYLCSHRGVAADDTEAMARFMEELRERSPKLFRLEVAPGMTPAAAPAPAAATAFRPAGDTAGELARLLENAPDAGR